MNGLRNVRTEAKCPSLGTCPRPRPRTAALTALCSPSAVTGGPEHTNLQCRENLSQQDASEGIMFYRHLAALAVLGLTASAAQAAERPVVVELFTSQGCSSCPPANAYLNEMVKQRRDVLALAFHVTYWDRLGWKDPFSLPTATDRQAVYGHRFGDGSYTPEIVVDGAAGMVGSDREQVGSAIENAKRNGQTAAAINVARNGDGLSIEVGAGSGQGRVLLVGFDREHTTAIGRGENSGRTLVEANV